MKIYASGDAAKLRSPGDILGIEMSRVVGLIDLGSNNADNNFGWCGVKAVVNVSDELYVLDFPEQSLIETNDGVRITDQDQMWWPNLDEALRYDLFIFTN